MGVLFLNESVIPVKLKVNRTHCTTMQHQRTTGLARKAAQPVMAACTHVASHLLECNRERTRQRLDVLAQQHSRLPRVARSASEMLIKFEAHAVDVGDEHARLNTVKAPEERVC